MGNRLTKFSICIVDYTYLHHFLRLCKAYETYWGAHKAISAKIRRGVFGPIKEIPYSAVHFKITWAQSISFSRSGKEAKITIEANQKATYREGLEEELNELRESEMWRTGAIVRKLRPENK